MRLTAKLIVQHPRLSMSFEKGSGGHGGGLIQVIIEHWTSMAMAVPSFDFLNILLGAFNVGSH